MGKKRKDYLDDYLDYDDFEYDYKSDPLYSAMKKQYLSEAERTAEDVLGKYSSVSGGGSVSSSAISAASAAANQQKSRLSEAIPTLYDLAWEMYKDELDSKREKYEAVLEEDKFLNSMLKSNEAVKEDEENTDNKTENNSGETTLGTGGNGTSSTEPFKPSLTDKKMADGIFDMTKNLIRNLVSAGDGEKARSMYNMYKNAMSQSQRNEIEKMLSA